MAETVSDSDSDLEVVTPVRPPPKRRRIIDPTALIAVPIYSNQVNSSLQLKQPVFEQTDCPDGDAEVPKLWPQSQTPPPAEDKPVSILSDSEEEPEGDKKQEGVRSPSPPPPPQSPRAKVSTRASRKIRELNRKLNAIGSLLSPVQVGAGHCRDDSEDDDVLIVSAPRAAADPRDREIPLKFRCGTDLHKIPMQSAAPLSVAVQQLSVKLKVPPSRILLLRKDVELPVDSTANELGLGIADIIDCVVITEDEQERERGHDIITVRLQGKDKGSAQDYSLHKEAPLGSILSQYLSRLGVKSRHKVRFLFDGSKVKDSHTPSQLDMEDGDVIEVWA